MNTNDMTNEIMKKLLEGSRTIPRGTTAENGKVIMAIKDIREMLDYMEKKVLGKDSVSKEEEKENVKAWKQSIQLLAEYVEQQK